MGSLPGGTATRDQSPDAPARRRTRAYDAPIGIFDCGVGGLTVARAVLDQLPARARALRRRHRRSPYGPRPIAEVRAFALDVMDHLVDQGVKMLVIACNSASAAVLRDARERYAVPVVEVIHPAVRRAVRPPATAGSASSAPGDDHQRGLRGRVRRGAALDLTPRPACPRFVEFVEAGVTSGRRAARRSPTSTSTRSRRPASTPWSSAARTTRC